MKQNSFKSNAINAVVTAIIRMLLGWAEEWGNDAFFFLVIGDKTCSDVAWHNTENLSCEGAFAVAEYPESAGALYNLFSSVETLLDDNLKQKDFRKTFEKAIPEKEDQGWCSLEHVPDTNDANKEVKPDVKHT